MADANPIQKILLPVDFSYRGEKAMPYTSALARVFGAEIEVLHACMLPDHIPPDLMIRVSKTSDLTPVKDAALAEAKRKMARFIEANGAQEVETTPSVVYSEAVAAIVEAAKNHDLIVLPTQSRSTIDRWFLGSVAEQVVRTATTPVLTLRPNAPNIEPPKNILVPVDFSNASDATLDLVERLSAKLGAKVHVLHVVPPFATPLGHEAWTIADPRDALTSLKDERAKTAEDNLERLLKDRASISRALVHGRPHELILEKAEEGSFDLIVMGTHGRTGLKKLLFGSVAARVLRASPCPVLTVRTSDPR